MVVAPGGHRSARARDGPRDGAPACGVATDRDFPVQGGSPGRPGRAGPDRAHGVHAPGRPTLHHPRSRPRRLAAAHRAASPPGSSAGGRCCAPPFPTAHPRGRVAAAHPSPSAIGDPGGSLPSPSRVVDAHPAHRCRHRALSHRGPQRIAAAHPSRAPPRTPAGGSLPAHSTPSAPAPRPVVRPPRADPLTDRPTPHSSITQRHRRRCRAALAPAPGAALRLRGADCPDCRCARMGAGPAGACGDGAVVCRMRLSWPEPSPRVDGAGLLVGFVQLSARMCDSS
ncbi:hypothetical protein SGLAU_06260 [Streptomyces glaucescens]|uniref:Uncharacterized protein n=1 Tax=Streptomyces glaucescens TaxID=1907 RepID=A0A089X2G4_STRGA|nr:hypothetical protein SGLAU_06260 [Streptomyces glaucescens]